MDDINALRARYRAERRLQELPGFEREDLGVVVRYTPLKADTRGFVCFTDIPGDDPAAEIGRQLDHFAARGTGFEWKVYGSDNPPGLRQALRQRGFREGDREALMVRSVLEPLRTGGERDDVIVADGTDDEMVVKRLEDPAGLVAFVRLQIAVWEHKVPSWLLGHLESEWEQGTAFFGAYHGDDLVGSGWIEYPPGSQFAEIHGGAMLPGFRGRGVYSRLLASRIDDARERGVRWLAVDAAPMSRPILEAKGFTRLVDTWPMTWDARLSS